MGGETIVDLTSQGLKVEIFQAHYRERAKVFTFS